MDKIVNCSDMDANRSMKRRLVCSLDSDESRRKRQKIDETIKPQSQMPDVLRNQQQQQQQQHKRQCSICLARIRNQQVGLLKPCGHSFCAKCIKRWSKRSNTCPIDRTPYEFIHVLRDPNDCVPRKILTVRKMPERCTPDSSKWDLKKNFHLRHANCSMANAMANTTT